MVHDGREASIYRFGSIKLRGDDSVTRICDDRPMNIFKDTDRERLLGRIHSLGPDSARRWGSLTLPGVLAHMAKQIELALGDLESQPAPSMLRRFGLKYLIIYVMPWPQGVKTAPVLLSPDADDVETERQGLVRAIERAAAAGPGGEWAEHPLFGPLPGPAWGALMAKHLDHHLRQFST